MLNRYVYPFLQDRGIPFGPIRRVVTGFVLAAVSMAWCALLQELVRPSMCLINVLIGIGIRDITLRVSSYYMRDWNGRLASGTSPCQIRVEVKAHSQSVWLAVPVPVLLGISEALAVSDCTPSL